jgi:hypothetical protein
MFIDFSYMFGSTNTTKTWASEGNLPQLLVVSKQELVWTNVTKPVYKNRKHIGINKIKNKDINH